jgi:hypothetical protein
MKKGGRAILGVLGCRERVNGQQYFWTDKLTAYCEAYAYDSCHNILNPILIKNYNEIKSSQKTTTNVDTNDSSILNSHFIRSVLCDMSTISIYRTHHYHTRFTLRVVITISPTERK